MRAKLIRHNGSLGVFLGLMHLLAIVIMLSSKNPLPPPKQCSPNDSCVDEWRDPFPGSIVVAERYFSLIDEPMPYRVLMLIDLPVAFIGAVVIWILKTMPLNLSLQSISYVTALVWLVLGTLQWWYAGMYLQKRFT